MTSLRFDGDLALWQGALIALAFGLGAWALYRREVRRGNVGVLRWVLPVLRTLAVVMILLMLTGPVLPHREVIGELGRVLVFVDASKSMSLTDEHMHAGRKLRSAVNLGWLDQEEVDTRLAQAADLLAEAQRAAGARQSTASATILRDRATQLASLAQQALDTASPVKVVSLPPARPQLGNLLVEYWNDIAGSSVGDLTNNPKYKQPATITTLADKFDSPRSRADNYGGRLRGFVQAPESGAYSFWVSSDDESELWLSTSEDPAGKKLIARANVTPPGQWQDGASRSQPIELEAGKRYYIEAIFKEGSGDDYLGVAWKLPSGAMEGPIPGSRLAPAVADTGDTPEAAFAKLITSLREDLVKQAQQLAGQNAGEGDEAEKASARLQGLATLAGDLESRLRASFDAYADTLIAAGDPNITLALEKFNQTTRWQRVEAQLLDKQNGLLAQLGETHHVELIALPAAQPQRLWWPQEQEQIPDSFELKPDGQVSNLSDGIAQTLEEADKGEKGEKGEMIAGNEGLDADRMAVVILSDGQHNDGASPLQVAKLLGSRGISVYAVGLGNEIAPGDLSVLDVEGPRSVFFEDRVHGAVLIKDDMPAGQPFELKISAGEKLIWSKTLVTENARLRRVPFDFAIKDLVQEQMDAKDKDVEIKSLPMAMKVSITPVEGESEKQNNDGELQFRAVTTKRKLLIIDGRPRWELRYLRNLFDRDQQWEVNTILADLGGNLGALRRGSEEGMFPADRQSLYAYDLIVFGDVPVVLLTDEELGWIADFVDKRAGGLIFLDGHDNHLGDYAKTPVGRMLPIERTGSEGSTVESTLQLTDAGRRIAALSLVSDQVRNSELWRSLPGPHWVAPVKALPGSETLAQAVDENGATPVLVFRRFGAGRVLYSGSDEWWRWRYEVADRFHQRLWNQIANWNMEAPFAVSDQYVSLDTGPTTYAVGDAADIRVRLRDEQGRPVQHATVEAVIYQDGKKVANVLLDADENEGGVFRGRTAPLRKGQYEVGVQVTGYNDYDMKARTSFNVIDRHGGELVALNCNEELLRQLAAAGNGAYYREESAGELVRRLEPLSQGRIVESETVLWQSYWWFVPIIALLSVEWLLRKRAGML